MSLKCMIQRPRGWAPSCGANSRLPVARDTGGKGARAHGGGREWYTSQAARSGDHAAAPPPKPLRAFRKHAGVAKKRNMQLLMQSKRQARATKKATRMSKQSK